MHDLHFFDQRSFRYILFNFFFLSFEKICYLAYYAIIYLRHGSHDILTELRAHECC